MKLGQETPAEVCQVMGGGYTNLEHVLLSGHADGLKVNAVKPKPGPGTQVPKEKSTPALSKADFGGPPRSLE
ncbi:unnamed protein product [Caretta caretta]